MKKSILLAITILVLYQPVLKAQHYCWNDINTLTTKWDNPNSANIEKWDWTKPGLVHPVYLKDNLNAPSILVELPYFCTKPPHSSSCGNANTLSYELTGPPSDQDIYPEDGCELILKDFGSPNDVYPGRGITSPIFIIYNKYTGRLKVYVALIGKLEANSAYLRVGFAETAVDIAKRVLFAHADPITKTLIEFDAKNNFKSLNDYSIQNFDDSYQWLVSEIQTSYDPCNCQNLGKPTPIEVRPNLIENSLVEATIEGNVNQVLMDPGGVTGETGGKTSFEDLVLGVGKSAIRGYNDFTTYKSQINGMLDKGNAEYKNKLITEWFNEFVKQNPQYQGINNLQKKYELWDAFLRTDDAYKKSLGIASINDYETDKDFQFVKSIASAIPYVGSAIGVIDFLFSGGKEAIPSKPSPPMVFNVSLKLYGKITIQKQKDPITFLAPGSTFRSNENLLPIYNNNLGVFNIIKPPAVNGVGIKPVRDPSIKFWGNHRTGEIASADVVVSVQNNKDMKAAFDVFEKTDIFRQYKLKEDVKYIVNPAAGLFVEMIDACFVLEYKGDKSLLINQRNYIDNIANNPSFPFYSGILNSVLTREQRISQIENTGLDLEFISDPLDVIRFRTKYVPLTCLANQSFTLFAGAPPTVYLKLLIKFKRKDNPNSEPITQIVTYDISSTFVSPNMLPTDCRVNPSIGKMLHRMFDLSGKESSVLVSGLLADFYTIRLLDMESFPEIPCLSFAGIKKSADISYTSAMPSQSVNGTIFIPDHTIVTQNTWLKAKRIVLGNGITIEDGVKLISETEINITPETEIHPNASINIARYTNVDTWSCPDVSIATLRATDEEIETQLCSSTLYKSKVMGKGGNNESPAPLITQKSTYGFTLMPNPASNNIALIISTAREKETITIDIMDVSGKLLISGIELNDASNKSEVNLDVSTLDVGIYFCSLTNKNGERVVKKFVIARK